jgi:hypothetical protein
MVLVELIIKKAGKKGGKGEKSCTVDRILGAIYYCYYVIHYLVLVQCHDNGATVTKYDCKKQMQHT